MRLMLVPASCCCCCSTALATLDAPACRSHTATTVGKLGTKQSNVKAGEWAISQQPRALWGNKAYYNTKD